MDINLIIKITSAVFLTIVLLTLVIYFWHNYSEKILNKLDGALKDDSKATVWSLQRLNSFQPVIISNICVWGFWLYASIFVGKMIEIPDSVLILYGSANGLAGLFKVWQAKYEKQSNKQAEQGTTAQ